MSYEVLVSGCRAGLAGGSCCRRMGKYSEYRWRNVGLDRHTASVGGRGGAQIKKVGEINTQPHLQPCEPPPSVVVLHSIREQRGHTGRTTCLGDRCWVTWKWDPYARQLQREHASDGLPASLARTSSVSQCRSFVRLSAADFWRCSERLAGAPPPAVSSFPQRLDFC